VRNGSAGGHTGCAENRITSWLKTLPHTIAASCVRPVSAVASCYLISCGISVYVRSRRRLALQLPCLYSSSVSAMRYNVCLEDESHLPITRFWYSGRPSCCEASPLLPRRGSSSLVPGCRCASLSAIFVSFNAGDGNVLCCAVDVLLELSSRQPKWMMTSLYQTDPQTITTRHGTTSYHRDLINNECLRG
jgi:hypothetical protein